MLVYEFANTLDERRFVQDGLAHTRADELASVTALEGWMRRRKLLDMRARLSSRDHHKAIELRDMLRDLLRLAPSERSSRSDQFNAVAGTFPLILEMTESFGFRLQPKGRTPLSGLARVLGDLYRAAEIGNLDRLKMCASDECKWVFFDHSKPATRRWCSSTLCGNREKTRAYRSRRRIGG